MLPAASQSSCGERRVCGSWSRAERRCASAANASFAVPPLTLPEDVTSADAVAGSEAGALFVERAREARPGFELTDGDAAGRRPRSAAARRAPARDRAGGGPDRAVLAGRAARPAARARRDLGGGTRDLPERQRTLRSTIEWSERLLDEDERSTFRLFSVFATARIDAVEAVAARLDGGRERTCSRGWSRSSTKSLVRSLDEDGHRRLAMLETIRDYAAERLDELPEHRDAAGARTRNTSPKSRTNGGTA